MDGVLMHRLEDFEPNFRFTPVDPLPNEEFEGRLTLLRRHLAARDCDAVIINAEQAGWYHTTNSFLRYLCDWMREGMLVIPVDDDKPATLLTFYGPEVVLPPPGEPTWVEDVRQVGIWGRAKYARPGDAVAKVGEAVAAILRDELGLARGRIALIGDKASQPYWALLRTLTERNHFQDETDVVLRMQRVRSTREQELVRAAAQLIDIGVQAAQHVVRPGVTDHELYAAFTYAQLERGGETGDGYQIGVNRFGTHVGKPYGHRITSGDIVNLYLSRVTYRGYDAQAARMIIVGEVSAEQEALVEACVAGVEEAMAVAGPGVAIRTVNQAALAPLIDAGFLDSADARAMPFCLEAAPDGTPRRIVAEPVSDPDFERQGRKLGHVYPASKGPLGGPGVGHSISMAGMATYGVLSTNDDVLEPGMTLVIHTQWFEPLRFGCNIGNSLLVTSDGVEDLNSHTDLAPFRL
jgi:Xaa-Pro aminopeptidase